MRETVGIHAGETERNKLMNDSVVESMTNDIFHFQLENFLNEGDELNARLNEFLCQCKEFPKYKYIINVLLDRLYCKYEEKDLSRLYEEMESDNALSQKSIEIINTICMGLRKKIEEIKIEDLKDELLHIYTEDIIKKNIYDLTEDFLIDFLAPILDLRKEEVNVFLCRVLKRELLCNLRDREFFLNLAIELYEKEVFKSTFEALYYLKKHYEELDVNDDKNDGNEKEKTNTQYICSKVNNMLGNIKLEKEVYERNDIDKFLYISNLLKWYKSLDWSEEREYKQQYDKLFDEVYELYEEDIDNYLLPDKQESKIKVDVKYKRRQESISLKAGTKFFGRNGTYFLDHDEILEMPKYVERYIKVTPLDENNEYANQEQDLRANNFDKDHIDRIQENNFLDPDIVFDIESDNNYLESGYNIINNVRTVRKSGETLDSTGKSKPKYRSAGYVIAEMLVEERIPDDLIINYKGFRFRPEEHEIAQLNKEIEIKLDLKLVNPDKIRKKGDYFVVDNVGTINRTNLEIEDVEIKNTHRITIEEEVYKKLKKGKKGQFCNFMYEMNKENYDSSELKGIDSENIKQDWFCKTIINPDDNWFNGLSYYEKRNVMLVLIFLKYIKEESNYDIKDSDVGQSRKYFIRNFEGYVNEYMKELKYDELYFGYPLDCVLMFLLTCEQADICDLLRALYWRYKDIEGYYNI